MIHRFERLAGILFLFALIAGSLSSCMDASLVSEPSAGVGISIQAAPSTLKTLRLRVSGPGMVSRSATLPIGADAVVLPIPIGPARRFELLGELHAVGNPGLDNPSVFYASRQQAPIVPGGTQVNLNLTLRSRILIPDSLGERLGEVPDLEGTLSEIDAEWISGDRITNTIPYDVDFGSAGAIYFVSDAGVERAISLASAPTLVVDAGNLNLRHIAIDRINDRLYIANSNTVAGAPIGAAPQPLPLTNGLNVAQYGAVQGIAVAPDGTLFVAQSTRVGRFDPASSTPIASVGVAPLNVADVVARSDGVYILINSRDNTSYNPAGIAIARLGPNLENVLESYGSTVNGQEGVPGSFLGPVRFLSTANQEITVADSDGGVSRIVQVRNVDGDGWREFQSAQDPFGFAPYAW